MPQKPRRFETSTLERRRLFASTVFNGFEYPIGPYPIVTVSADFNGDGAIDSATAQGDHTISVLLNEGNANFAPAVTYPIGLNPTQMFAADINGDGHTDLIVNTSSDDLLVLYGNGNGSFNAPVDYPGDGGPTIAVGDIDGDGRPDILLSNNTYNRFFVIYGNGSSNLATPVSYTDNVGAFGYTSLALGDINHDGKLDVVAIPNEQYGPGPFEVFYNRGARTFSASTSFNVGIGGVLSVVDLNGDGYADVIGYSSFAVTAAINNGQGGFNSAVAYVSNSPIQTNYFTSLAIADINGDNRPDLITSNSSDYYPLSIYLNSGNGTFGSPVFFPGGNESNVLSVADFNNDGHPDLSLDTGTSFIVRLGRGDGTFAAGPFTSGINTNYVKLADLNNDGMPDLITLSGNNVDVQLASSPGIFGSAVAYPVPATPNGITTADFNNDGLQDIAVSIRPAAYGGQISVLLNKGAGLFSPAVTYTVAGSGLSTIAAPVAGDFNGDGKIDIAFFFQNNDSGAVIDNQGGGTFGGTTSYFYLSGTAYGGVVGNFNADTVNDLAVDVNNTLYIFMGRATGGFAAAVTYSVSGGLAAGADLNGDGKTDLLISNTRGATIWMNNGSGGFLSGTTYNVSNTTTSEMFADVNGDGKYDLVINSNITNLDIFLGNGDGTFQADSSYDIGGQLTLPQPQSLGASNQSSYSVVDPVEGRVLALARLTQAQPFTSLTGGTLTINASSAGGAVSLSQANGSVLVSAANGTYSFAAASTNSILVNASSGSPVVNLLSSLSPTVVLAAGSLPLIVNAIAGSTTLINSGSTNLIVNDDAAIVLSANQSSGIGVIRLAALNISTGATASISTPAGISNRDLLVLGNLLASGTLDMGASDLDLLQTSLATATQFVSHGFNAGTWTGTGIASSTAAGDSTHLTALGIVQNNQNGTPLFSSANLFDGIAPSTTDVLIKYTYFGDTNFSGKTDGSDYSRIDAAYLNPSTTGWFNGDFNYDGIVNGSDYTLIDNAFNRQTVSLASQLAPPGKSPPGTPATFIQSTIDPTDQWIKKHHKRPFVFS